MFKPLPTDKQFRDSCLAGFPLHWAGVLAEEHKKGLASADALKGVGTGSLASDKRRAVNLRLLESSSIRAGRLSLDASDDDIKEAADEAAQHGMQLAAFGKQERNDADLLVLLERHAEAWGIVPPDVSRLGIEPTIKRLCCKRWWLRRLRKAHAMMVEAAARKAGLVSRSKWAYVSQDTLERRKQQKRRNAAAMAEAVLVDIDTGEMLDMGDAAAASVANPVNRRNELMVRIAGIEHLAKMAGHGAKFITLTAPSHMHRMAMRKGKAYRNGAWTGENPREVQGYLCKLWARARAAWKREGLDVLGIRVAEPHHDGTPHWHILAFGEEEKMVRACEILRSHALKDSPEEAGADKHRLTIVDIDPSRGSAAGYVAKYIAKNIDGFGVGDADEASITGEDNAARVDAWAGSWGIRQFQFFGVASVTLWRVLRKMEHVDVEGIEAARVAADSGDWAGFSLAAKKEGVKLAKDVVKFSNGIYGDAPKPVPVAVVIEVPHLGFIAGRVEIERRNWVVHWGGFSGFRRR